MNAATWILLIVVLAYSSMREFASWIVHFTGARTAISHMQKGKKKNRAMDVVCKYLYDLLLR